MTNDADKLQHILSGLASYFAGKRGLQAAWLFGSHNEGRSHRDSDIDVAVLLEHVRYPDARARFEARVATIVAAAAGTDCASAVRRRDRSTYNCTPPPRRDAAGRSTARPAFGASVKDRRQAHFKFGRGW